MINWKDPEVDFATSIVRKASLLSLIIEREMVTPALSKHDRSPVTVADYAVQTLIGHAISKAFPEDPLVAEEDSSALCTESGRAVLEQVLHFISSSLPKAHPDNICNWIDRGRGKCSQRFWTLDPIDGTKGFLRGDQYALALALVVNGRLKLGVLGCPKLGPGWIITAVRGQGCWRTPLKDENQYEPLRVSKCKEPSSAQVLRSFESAHTNEILMEKLLGEMGVQKDPLRMDSQAKYALLAEGAGDCLFRLLSPDEPDYIEKIWDHAAGTLIVEEAGGKVTDLKGKPLNFACGELLIDNYGLLASNGLMHDAALQLLAKEFHL